MVLCNGIAPERRAQLAATLLANAGTYGVVTAMSHTEGVSRQTLYNWKAQGQHALTAAFGPALAVPTRLPSLGGMGLGGMGLERPILTALMEGHASERGIQHCLDAFGYGPISLGSISAVVSEAERRALAWTSRLQAPTTPRGIALDELFVARRNGAALSIVDVDSWAVWQTVGPVTVDLDAWVLTLWQAQAQGLVWHTTVSDGNRAITGATALVDPEGVHVRDVWHILHEGGLVQGRIDRHLQRLVDRAPAIARQAERVAAGLPPRGRNPLSDLATYEAQVAIEQGQALGLRYLRQELRRLLEVVVSDHRGVLPSQLRLSELGALLELLDELAGGLAGEGSALARREIDRLATTLRHALPDLLRWTKGLDALQARALDHLGKEGLSLVAWAWQRRRVLSPTPKLLEMFPPDWREVAGEMMMAWDRVVRASSAVENWHSLLRPHLAVHRRLTPGLLALVAVWHNHRVFERGVHRGRNPLQISGIADAPTDWLVALGYPPLANPTPGDQPANKPTELARAA